MNEKILLNLKIFYINNFNKFSFKNQNKFESEINKIEILLDFEKKAYLKESEDFEIFESKMNKN
jgi:hypothetical protein